MGDKIDVAFVQQYSDNLIHLVQQKGSRLLPTVMSKQCVGKAAYFDRLGATTALEKTTRHALSDMTEVPHSRRKIYMRDFYTKDYIDEEDELRLIIDPKSAYAMAQAWALGRKIDDLIIAKATGNAVAADEDEAVSNVALTATQYVSEDVGVANSNLNVEKLIDAQRIFDASDVDPDEERYCIFNASAKAALLNTTKVTSSDYASVKALVEGKIDTFMGFKFILSNRILGAGSEGDPVLCLAYTKSAMGFALGRDITVRMDEIPERHYATQVYAAMSGDATRIEEEKMVAIKCVQV